MNQFDDAIAQNLVSSLTPERFETTQSGCHDGANGRYHVSVDA